MQQGICRELKPGIRIENEAIVVNPYEGCDYNCAYCRFRSSRYPVKPHPSIAKHLEEVLQENPDLPVIIGAETEPLGPSEVKQGLTLRCMEVLKDQARPYTILTKSDLIAIPKYLSQAYYAEVQLSFSTPMDYSSRIMEMGAPVTHQRLKVANILLRHQIKVIARVEPIIPDRPDYWYSLGRREDNRKFVYWHNTLIPLLAKAGIKEVLVGMARLDLFSIDEIKERFGFDLTDFYILSPEQILSPGMIYSSDEEEHYLSEVESLAKLRKMYVGRLQ